MNSDPSTPGGLDPNNSTVDAVRCYERGKVVKPDTVVPEITQTQCQNIKDNHGIYGNLQENCPDFTGELLCDIRQVLEYVLNMGVGNVFANDDSKCSDDDAPTLASMWSRIYRFAQAVTCVLCAYDPFINTLLKSGRFPQVLMGAQTEDDRTMDGCCRKVGYPTWVTPDEYPTYDSNRPVSAGGISRAIKDAILSVWHLWEEEPNFNYFAQTVNGADDPFSLMAQMEKWPAVEGDTCLIAHATECGNKTAIYQYRHDNDPSGELEVKWRFNECVEVGGKQNLTNFAVTHIFKGRYADKGMYFFDDTWQVMDADLGTIEDRVERLEGIYENAVTVLPGTTQIVFGTAATLEEAKAYPCDPEKDTIILVTG